MPTSAVAPSVCDPRQGVDRVSSSWPCRPGRASRPNGLSATIGPATSSARRAVADRRCRRRRGCAAPDRRRCSAPRRGALRCRRGLVVRRRRRRARLRHRRCHGGQRGVRLGTSPADHLRPRRGRGQRGRRRCPWKPRPGSPTTRCACWSSPPSTPRGHRRAGRAGGCAATRRGHARRGAGRRRCRGGGAGPGRGGRAGRDRRRGLRGHHRAARLPGRDRAVGPTAD